VNASRSSLFTRALTASLLLLSSPALAATGPVMCASSTAARRVSLGLLLIAVLLFSRRRWLRSARELLR